MRVDEEEEAWTFSSSDWSWKLSDLLGVVELSVFAPSLWLKLLVEVMLLSLLDLLSEFLIGPPWVLLLALLDSLLLATPLRKLFWC